nr:hypothetical protein GCM10020093_090120 [Planobispora longispora]
MRRWATLVAAVLVGSVLPAGTAQAVQAPPSPVTKLKQHFAEHVGLRISDVGRVYKDGKAVVTIWRRGKVEFDASGVYATDTTGRTEAGRGAIKEFEGSPVSASARPG